ncbi:MAG: hypothetical protein ACPGSB_00400 [Opitutales bacterium]
MSFYGVKKLLFWVVLIAGGYYGLDYVKVHTSSDVVAYKRFAKALIENDLYSARQASNRDLAEKAFATNPERMKYFRGARVLFTYYDVISQKFSKDGQTSFLVVEQVSRTNSNGKVGFWGDGEIRIRQTARLEKEDLFWKVTNFTDPAML